MRHRPLRPLPVRARPSSARTARSSPTSDSRPIFSDAGDLSMARRTQAQARRLEVRLLRRLPAQPARLRGRAAGGRRRGRDRLFPRGHAGRGQPAPTISRWSKARSPPPMTPSASTRSAASRGALVTIGACATAGGIQALRNFADVDEFMSRRLRPAGIHQHARHLDADRGPCAGRFRAARLPDQQAPAARGHQRLPARRPQAGGAAAQRLRRVQARRAMSA